MHLETLSLTPPTPSKFDVWRFHYSVDKLNADLTDGVAVDAGAGSGATDFGNP